MSELIKNTLLEDVITMKERLQDARHYRTGKRLYPDIALVPEPDSSSSSSPSSSSSLGPGPVPDSSSSSSPSSSSSLGPGPVTSLPPAISFVTNWDDGEKLVEISHKTTISHPIDLMTIGGRTVCLLGEGNHSRVYGVYSSALEKWTAVKIPRRNRPEGKSLDAREGDTLYSDMFRSGFLAGNSAFPEVYSEEKYEMDSGITIVECCLDSNVRNLGKTMFERVIIKNFGDLLGALAIIHRNNCSHNNLKPSNLLIGQDARLVLSGFGAMRKCLDEKQELENVPGTYVYMAPELFVDGTMTYDSSKTDVWSLGIILLEALGSKPSKVLGLNNLESYKNFMIRSRSESGAWDRFIENACKENNGLLPDVIPRIIIPRMCSLNPSERLSPSELEIIWKKEVRQFEMEPVTIGKIRESINSIIEKRDGDREARKSSRLDESQVLWRYIEDRSLIRKNGGTRLLGLAGSDPFQKPIELTSKFWDNFSDADAGSDADSDADSDLDDVGAYSRLYIQNNEYSASSSVILPRVDGKLLGIIGGGSEGRVYAVFVKEMDNWVALKISEKHKPQRSYFFSTASEARHSGNAGNAIFLELCEKRQLLKFSAFLRVFSIDSGDNTVLKNFHPSKGSDSGVTRLPERPVFASEYCWLGDLETMDGSQALDLFTKNFSLILAALCKLHETSHCHCDIKPANFLARIDGTVAFGDFGLLRQFNPGGDRLDHIVGTRYFMSPELLLSDGERYLDLPKNDIWALGITTARLLLGGNIFEKSMAKGCLAFKNYMKDKAIDQYEFDNFLKNRLGNKVNQPLGELTFLMCKVDPQNRPTAKTLLNIIKSKLEAAGDPSYRQIFAKEVELSNKPPLIQETEEMTRQRKERKAKMEMETIGKLTKSQRKESIDRLENRILATMEEEKIILLEVEEKINLDELTRAAISEFSALYESKRESCADPCADPLGNPDERERGKLTAILSKLAGPVMEGEEDPREIMAKRNKQMNVLHLDDAFGDPEKTVVVGGQKIREYSEEATEDLENSEESLGELKTIVVIPKDGARNSSQDGVEQKGVSMLKKFNKVQKQLDLEMEEDVEKNMELGGGEKK
ncbi:MAG: protein kinase [Rickettsiales bacterium]|jgi:serine/threonine protein kinase|nr:protein kinase [Rickettsiales bacterium]